METLGAKMNGEIFRSQPTITGQQLTSSIGTLQSVSGNAIVEPSGTSLTSSLGEELAGISVTVQVTGSLEFAVGSTTVGIGVSVTEMLHFYLPSKY